MNFTIGHYWGRVNQLLNSKSKTMNHVFNSTICFEISLSTVHVPEDEKEPGLDRVYPRT